jgi:hypothetical protein
MIYVSSFPEKPNQIRKNVQTGTDNSREQQIKIELDWSGAAGWPGSDQIEEQVRQWQGPSRFNRTTP